MQAREAIDINVVELPEPWRSAAVTVVLPTYNEAANLPAVVKALFDLPLTGLRVLVADDNSPDGTGAVADELAESYGAERLLIAHRPGKEGLGRAYVDGMTRALQAGAEFVVQMDADLSHPPACVPQMLGALLSTDADVVIGSRYVIGASLADEWGWRRRALSRWANVYVQLLLRMQIRDVTAGFKIWRAKALQTIDLANIGSNGYSFQVEMNYRALRRGLKIVEVPIHFAERTEGASKMSASVQLESALMPFKLRRSIRLAFLGCALELCCVEAAACAVNGEDDSFRVDVDVIDLNGARL
jgi:dolichol-phosphate mannosyltransferase